MNGPSDHHTPKQNTLASAMKRIRGGVTAVVLFSFFINLLMLAVPLYMLQVFDRVLTSRSVETLLYLTLAAAIALAALGLLDMVRSGVMVRIGDWLDARLAGPLLDLSIDEARRSTGIQSAGGLRDLRTFRTFLTGPAVFPIMDAPWTPIFLIVLFILHPLIGWIGLAGAVVLFCLAVLNELWSRKGLARYAGASQGSLAKADMALRNAEAAHAMGMTRNIVERWQRENAEATGYQTSASLAAGRFTALAKSLRLFLQVGVLGTGAWLVIQGEITPGVMIAGSILMGRALAPVDQLIASWRGAVAARASYKRIAKRFASAPQNAEPMRLPAPKGELKVERLMFRYPGATEPLLRNINFSLDPGESLGLIGPTASGKTTLARLLTGNLSPELGAVRLDGADIAQWTSDDVGQYLGYLPQDVELFDGTVRENIARMADGDPEHVVAAAQLADVHEMILGFPNGYDTFIGAGGIALSGGQSQRIGLARALYGQPKFVVLDEPNANLDSAGERALLSALNALTERDTTTVIISHRPSILRHVDKVLELGNGTVRRFGKRDEIFSQLAQIGGRGSAQNAAG